MSFDTMQVISHPFGADVGNGKESSDMVHILDESELTDVKTGIQGLVEIVQVLIFRHPGYNNWKTTIFLHFAPSGGHLYPFSAQGVHSAVGVRHVSPQAPYHAHHVPLRQPGRLRAGQLAAIHGSLPILRPLPEPAVTRPYGRYFFFR